MCSIPRWCSETALVPLQPVACGGGLMLTLLPMPGKVPLYLEERGATEPEPGPNYAALLEANGRSVIVAPACADITRASFSNFAGRSGVLRWDIVHR